MISEDPTRGSVSQAEVQCSEVDQMKVQGAFPTPRERVGSLVKVSCVSNLVLITLLGGL